MVDCMSNRMIEFSTHVTLHYAIVPSRIALLAFNFLDSNNKFQR